MPLIYECTRQLDRETVSVEAWRKFFAAETSPYVFHFVGEFANLINMENAKAYVTDVVFSEHKFTYKLNFMEAEMAIAWNDGEYTIEPVFTMVHRGGKHVITHVHSLELVKTQS